MARGIGLIVLLAVSLKLGEANGEGGPSSFGYDASSACSKPYSRVGRARHENLPCDFSRENWCTIAGNAYPWQAVKRFVQENQGLMRRMYGDEKHFSVLKTELEKSDVELELENEHNLLYTEDASSNYRQFRLDPDFEQPRRRDHHGRALNTGTSSKLDKPKTGEEPLPRHPNETPTASTTPYATSTSSATTTPSTSSTIKSTTTTTTTTAAASSTAKTRTRMTPVTSTSSPTSEETPTPTSNATTSTVTPPLVKLAEIANVQNNLSINEIPGQIDRFDADVDELTEIPELLAETTLQIEELLNDQPIPELLPTSSESSDLPQNDAEASESQQQQQFRPRPEYRPPENSGAGSTEGQLFQDAAKDQQEAPVLKVRGINACPVKEEVVAPFWANNTRGEVLALLNLYPFEQYVHWEKCTHENKQMYCRDGCRCEQQYRLHRLLAYDPNNECRGIFSDWFKFPSCCICRCYDLPLEFRVTSRSPRNLPRQRLKVRAPRTPPPPIRSTYN